MPKPIIIPLTQGKSAIIDAVDWELISRYRWCAKRRHPGTWYAFGTAGKKIAMHRVIMGEDTDSGRRQIDHVNGNGLDNRRANLRFATHSENGANRRLDHNSKTGYKGVSWEPDRQRWRATIHKDNRTMNIGRFDSAEDAAHAYDEAALRMFGRYARTNFNANRS